MCVIVYKKENINISQDIIEKCYRKNPDGAGIAIKRENTFEVFKGLFSPQEVWNNVQNNMDTEMIIHFRLGTSGLKNSDMCHPFPIKKRIRNRAHFKCSDLLFHNGVLTEYSWPGDKSDTYIFSKILAKVNEFDQLYLLEKYISSNRFVYIKNAFPMLLGKWEEKNGIYYSNLRWEEKHIYFTDFRKGYINLFKNIFPEEKYF